MKTILVADDRETSRELIRTVLEHSGYRVLEAANGAEAVLLAMEEKPDLMLLDLQMPIKDGFEVLKELRSNPQFKSVPILAVTASAMYGDREQALGIGFTNYLTKPLSFAVLREELARLLSEGVDGG